MRLNQPIEALEKDFRTEAFTGLGELDHYLYLTTDFLKRIPRILSEPGWFPEDGSTRLELLRQKRPGSFDLPGTEDGKALPTLSRRNTLRAGQRVLLLRHVRRRSSPRSVRRGEVKKL